MVGAQGNLWERIKSWLTDYRTWTTMLYMVLQLPLGIVYFTVMVTALSLSAAHDCDSVRADADRASRSSAASSTATTSSRGRCRCS